MGTELSDVHAVVEQDTSGAPGANNVDLMTEFKSLDEARYLQQIFLMRTSGYFNHIEKAIRGTA